MFILIDVNNYDKDMAKYVLFCINHSAPPIELSEKISRLGPPVNEAPFSRVEAFADYHRGRIHVKNLGVTKCLINFTKILRHGEETLAVPGDTIDLCFSTFVYQIRAWSGPLPGKEGKGQGQGTMNKSPANELHKTSNKGVQKFIVSDKNKEAFYDKQSRPSNFQRRSLQQIQGGQGQSQSQGRSSGSESEDGLGGNVDQAILNKVIDPHDTGMVGEDSSIAMLDNDDILKQLEEEEEENAPVKKRIKDSDWRIVQGILGPMPVLVYGGENALRSKPKVAGFDLDMTIIKPAPGIDDSTIDLTKSRLWEFLYSTTAQDLADYFALHPDHKFVIVTNKAKLGWEQFSKKIIEEVVLQLDIPVIVFAAKEGTEFLKPAHFLWEAYKTQFNEGVEPDWRSSFFCGDCAGRTKDVSKGDRLFALNVGADFKTPEGFFLNVMEDPGLFYMPKFNPREYVNSALVAKNNDHIKYPNKLEIIVMCGIVGSGKSRFVERTLEPKGYFVIRPGALFATNKDRLDALAQSLHKKTSVVVDRRNIDSDERASYIRLSQSYKVPIRCFVTNVTEEHARHNLRFLEIRMGRLTNSGEMEICMRRHKALFEMPTTLNEGFSEVVTVNFIPQNFMGAADLEIYSKFLIQK